tara:strand:+ start:662 stop:964 length:303 start_codon:yes stop_codon:yes gene_type:complete
MDDAFHAERVDRTHLLANHLVVLNLVVVAMDLILVLDPMDFSSKNLKANLLLRAARLVPHQYVRQLQLSVVHYVTNLTYFRNLLSMMLREVYAAWNVHLL